MRDLIADAHSWKDRTALFLHVIEDIEYRQAALNQAQNMRENADPEIQPSDLFAGTRYLRKCMDNLRFGELQHRGDEEFVALWARGALGAARYRAGKARRR